MNRIFFLVGIGGFIGSVSRYYSSLFFAKHFSTQLPIGTLAVNIAGCLLIGIIYGMSERSTILSAEWRLFLATGLIGGFTTFSAFSYESINLIRSGEFFILSLYVAASIIIGFAATYLGITIIKSI